MKILKQTETGITATTKTKVLKYTWSISKEGKVELLCCEKSLNGKDKVNSSESVTKFKDLGSLYIYLLGLFNLRPSELSIKIHTPEGLEYEYTNSCLCLVYSERSHRASID